MTSPTQSTVCCAMALSVSSKSNIPAALCPPENCSAVSVGTIEILRHITPHRVFERRERGLITGAPQINGHSLRKILVAVANRGRHLDILDCRFAAERIEHCGNQIAKAARHARAGVEYPRDRRRVEQPPRHCHRVVDADEIPLLLAVADA